MTDFHIWRLIVLADELEEKLEKTVNLGDKTDYNRQFQAQRDMLARFHDFFKRRLRMVLGQMESDLGTLRVRGFNSNMRRLLSQVYKRLEEIFRDISEDKPYIAAQALVDYVGDRHHRSIIDNLEFLAQHHLQTTKPETIAPLPANVRQILTAESLPMVKELAQKLQEHMEQFPLLEMPLPTPIPPRIPPATESPEGKAGPEDLTKI